MQRLKLKDSKYSLNLDFPTWKQLQNLAIKNRKQEFEAQIVRACMHYMDIVRDTDAVDRDGYILIRRRDYDIDCPFCGKTVPIDMEAIEEWGNKEAEREHLQG